jgi:para-nitrobenzyl esterase
MKKILLFLSITLHLAAQDVIIKTSKGAISGTLNSKTNIQKFLGIPFAKPPVGELRWKAPVPMESWTGKKEAKAFGPSPMQAKPAPFAFWSSEFLIPESPISEDCLYLNVWAPKSPQGKKAVLVYIYGGGFRSGGAACPIYDGENMAQKDIVFVSINYRVGIFGFLAHPELSAEAPYGSSGNYALLDMIAALKWIKENISAFGGDPNQVTIAGQSAGAFAVNFLCASPLAKGLFQGAIAESGASMLPSPLRPAIKKAQAENNGLEWAAKVGAKSLAELRALSAEAIQNAGGNASPYSDGFVLPLPMPEIYAKNLQNDVPILVGWNSEDRLSAKAAEPEVFIATLEKRFGAKGADVLAAYGPNGSLDLGRDESFGVQVHTWAKTQNMQGKAPVYVYNFNRAVPGYDEATRYGAFHTGEVPYAYANLHTVNRPFEAIDQVLSQKMSSYWVNFTKTGNPNGAGLEFWPTFNAKDQKVQILDKVIETKELPTRKTLELLESIN